MQQHKKEKREKKNPGKSKKEKKKKKIYIYIRWEASFEQANKCDSKANGRSKGNLMRSLSSRKGLGDQIHQPYFCTVLFFHLFLRSFHHQTFDDLRSLSYKITLLQQEVRSKERSIKSESERKEEKKNKKKKKKRKKMMKTKKKKKKKKKEEKEKAKGVYLSHSRPVMVKTRPEDINTVSPKGTCSSVGSGKSVCICVLCQ